MPAKKKQFWVRSQRPLRPQPTRLPRPQGQQSNQHGQPPPPPHVAQNRFTSRRAFLVSWLTASSSRSLNFVSVILTFFLSFMFILTAHPILKMFLGFSYPSSSITNLTQCTQMLGTFVLTWCLGLMKDRRTFPPTKAQGIPVFFTHWCFLPVLRTS